MLHFRNNAYRHKKQKGQWNIINFYVSIFVIKHFNKYTIMRRESIHTEVLKKKKWKKSKKLDGPGFTPPKWLLLFKSRDQT